MGGVGSGRPSRHAPTVERMETLSIGPLVRQGLLSAGAISALSWSSGRAIHLRAEADHVVLIYRAKATGGDWQDVEQDVGIERVRLRYGLRPYFACPMCRRRCTALLVGVRFACRVCCRIKHGSTRERPEDRAHRRANRIRRQLGWEPGVANDRGGKPAGMHWSTYRRLVARHDQAASEADAGLRKAIERLTGRCL